MNKYVGVSFAYGFARSVGHVNNLKVPVPSKVALVSYSTVAAPVYLPVYLMNDLNRLFIKVAGEKPEDYGYHPKKTAYDIMFT